MKRLSETRSNRRAAGPEDAGRPVTFQQTVAPHPAVIVHRQYLSRPVTLEPAGSVVADTVAAVTAAAAAGRWAGLLVSLSPGELASSSEGCERCHHTR